MFTNRLPLYVELTRKCNLGCGHCFYESGSVLEADPTFVKGALAAARRAGWRAVVLTGGEPFLYDRLEEIADYARHLGLGVGIFTNGTVSSPAFGRLTRLVQTMAFSLDGPEDVHDARRGKGSYARAVQAIEEARAAGKNVHVQVTVGLKTHPRAVEVLRKCSSLGVRSVSVAVCSTVHPGRAALGEVVPPHLWLPMRRLFLEALGDHHELVGGTTLVPRQEAPGSHLVPHLVLAADGQLYPHIRLAAEGLLSIGRATDGDLSLDVGAQRLASAVFTRARAKADAVSGIYGVAEPEASLISLARETTSDVPAE